MLIGCTSPFVANINQHLLLLGLSENMVTHIANVYIYIYIIIIIIIYIYRQICYRIIIIIIIIIIYIYIGLNYIVDQTKCNSLPIKMLDS